MSELETAVVSEVEAPPADDKPQVEHKPGAAPSMGDVAIQGAKPTAPDEIKLSRAQYERLAEYIQKNEDRARAAKDDPWKVFGDDLDDDALDTMAARRLAAKQERLAQAEREKSDPLAKRERELKEYEASLEEKARKFEAERYEQHVSLLDNRFTAIVDQVVGQLPEGLRGQEAQLRAIDRLAAAVDAGEDVTMDELVAHVRSAATSSGRAYIKSAEVKDLLDNLSDAQRDALRQALGAPAETAPPPVRAGTSRSAEQAPARREGHRPDAVNDAFSDSVRQITEKLNAATKVVW